MSQSAVAGFLAVSLVVIAVPGPSVIFAIGRALSVGRRQALLAVLGNASGVFVQIVVIAFGRGLVVTGSELALLALRIGGAIYLVWLGVATIRDGYMGRTAFDDRLPAPTATPWRDGLVVGVANPKTFVFLAALLPRYAEPGAGPLPAQMLLLGAVFCVIAIVIDGSWAIGAAQARRWLASDPRRLTATAMAGGVVLILLGLFLAAG